MADFLAQYGTLIGIALVLVALFGGKILAGVKAVGSFVAAKLPSLISLKPSSGKIELTYLQLAGLMLAMWLMAGGVKGCSLPGWPSWPIGPAPPIADAGFRVLLKFDSKVSNDKWDDVFYSPEIRAYLNSKCVKGPDGKTPEWRKLDATATMTNESPLWQTAMKRQHKSLPWVVASNPPKGFEGELPEVPTDALLVLKRIGGE